ncbi:hypothetical protein ACH5RR_005675 [Cinchona calisaya]|uniref:Brix domain-containing protein n=1 Tax=Cinchona calisaya TaxID=153742 RepID=A0ABD3ALW5_9GENT
MKRLLFANKSTNSPLENKGKTAGVSLQSHIIVPRSTVDDEYINAMKRDPKILLTTSCDPSAPLTQFVKELKFVFPNTQRMNCGRQVISEIIETCRAHDFMM